MVLTVEDGRAHVDDGVAGLAAVLHGLADAGLDGGDVLPRDDSAGDRVDEYCDAEIVDSIDYTQWPNFHPWGAFNKIVYRFRPNGDDHRTSIMECYQLMPFQGERPPAAPIHWLGNDEKWSSALGFLGRVFDQDVFNMPKVQMGLESTYKPGVTLSAYQEGKVRWLHHKLTEWVGE